jgi:prepilin-type N-terminal cleavage/methylation domain-containing protein/prepilin-type processing-associated H-X9-DG protein
MRCRRQRRSAGFTLVELLVVISIITILMSLLLPAVQKVRDAAARAQCANNMRQLSLACLNYESATKRFPLGDERNAPVAIVWHAVILPYIDQGNLAVTYNYKAHWSDASNNAAINKQVSIFNCPATPGQPRWDTTAMELPGGALGPDPGPPGAVCDYWGVNECDPRCVVANPVYFSADQVAAAQAAVTAGLPPSANLIPQLVGVMCRGSLGATRFADIADGSSESILFTEGAGRPSQYGSGRRQLGNLDPGEARWADPNGNFNIVGCNPAISARDAVLTKNVASMNCENGNEPYSFHAGGCNFAFSDGSVHFLSDQTPVGVIGQMATRAGGEVIQDLND